MRKQKGERLDTENLESKSKKIFEEANHFIKKTKATYKDAALKFQVNRNSLSRFMKYGFLQFIIIVSSSRVRS